jgi:hypothetical protein
MDATPSRVTGRMKSATVDIRSSSDRGDPQPDRLSVGIETFGVGQGGHMGREAL